ncbi:MAG: TIGR04282 family arsenosugar biosynthesis glycosyltransferase [Verrucomicrobiota bacterium]|nr:TIGR04282 family arsenosugar biosynthesis glycosyltransferase [Verrucomicrobiota bacterium]
MSLQTLIIFLKAPRIGLVKTRLAQTIGPATARDAYKKLVETLLQNLAPLADVELRFAPDDAAAEIQLWKQKNWTMRPQGKGDLGQRLQAAFAQNFSIGTERVVIIGSDCPHVTAMDIESAWTALKTHDVVLGPARDGGYWLIGLRQLQPVLLENISWSTETVLRETIQRAQKLFLKIYLLRELTDVDTEPEWREWNNQL